MRGNSVLARAAQSAKKDSATKKKRKSSSSESDSSEDSDVIIARREKKLRKKELEKTLEKDRDAETSITQQIEAQKTKNEKRMQELRDVRLSYPVFYVSAQIPILCLHSDFLS